MTDRNDHEGPVIDRFRKVAEDFGFMRIFDKQKKDNCFDPGWGLSVKQQFQFGDLRVELKDRHVIVEPESSGGTTNLLKYWALLKNKPEQRPIFLLHVFQKGSQNDYISHRKLCEFIKERIREDIGQRMIAEIFTYTDTDMDKSLEPAISHFKHLLTASLEELMKEVS